MTRSRFRLLLTVVVFVVLVGLSTSASSPTGGDYWVFVTAYLLIALYAASIRHWIAVAAALAVAAVRSMVAWKTGGAPFEIASSLFVALFFLMVQMHDRRRGPR